MARIRSIEKSTSDARAHPTLVDCGYQVVDAADGRLLQLSTYGSDLRKSEPKVSQTLQFDRERAGQLVQIIREAFPDL